MTYLTMGETALKLPHVLQIKKSMDQMQLVLGGIAIFFTIIVSQNIAVLQYIVTFCQHNYKTPHLIIT